MYAICTSLASLEFGTDWLVTKYQAAVQIGLRNADGVGRSSARPIHLVGSVSRFPVLHGATGDVQGVRQLFLVRAKPLLPPKPRSGLLSLNSQAVAHRILSPICLPIPICLAQSLPLENPPICKYLPLFSGHVSELANGSVLRP